MKLLALLVLTANLCAAQQGVIAGKVLAKESHEPLVFANVLLDGTTVGTVTNASGEFRFPKLPVGTYNLTVSLIGYRRYTLSNVAVIDQETTRVTVSLEAAPVQAQPVIVSASKREQAVQEVPVSVATMDAASIARRNIVTLDDALRYIPGVNLTDWQVNIRGSSGYSRGAGSRVLLLVDGIPFITGDTGELNFETIPAGQVERIEVVKGAGSALYGSSALGGVVNIITKAIPEEAETRVRMYGGFYSKPSFDQWDWGGGTRFLDGESFSHSQMLGDVGIALFGSRAADDGYKQNDYRRRYNGYLKLHTSPSMHDDVSATFNIMHQKRGSFLYWRNLDSALIPPPTQLGNYVESNRFFTSAVYTHTASSSFLTTVRAMWFHNRFDDVIDTATHVSRSDVLRGEAQAVWHPDESNTVTFGIEGNTDNVDANLFGKRSGSGIAFYAQEEYAFTSALRATIGARQDFQHLDSVGSMSQFNPKAGVSFTPTPTTTLRASFGRGFRTPSVAEAFLNTSISGLQFIPNPSLKPERSYTFEVGITQFVQSNVMMDLALFQSDFSNLIEAGFTPQFQGQFNNVTKARIQGLEASLRCAFDAGVSFDAGYTYVYPKDLTTNDILKYRPRHLLYASGLWTTGMVSIGIDVRYISRMERIDDEFVRQIIPGVAPIIPDGDRRVATYVADARFGADCSCLGLPTTLQLNVNNIFQYNYVELIGNLAPPRSVVLTVETRL